MDQDSVVTEQIEGGRRLLEMLREKGFEVVNAFWAKPTEDGKWFLYLASPFVDQNGPMAAYRLVNSVLRATPDLWIKPLDVKVIGLDDSLTQAAMDLVKPRAPDGPFAVGRPRIFPGMTRFGGATLGGLDVDGALIYPPLTPSAAS